MIKYESLLSKEPSDLCLVVGDVNSTMACSIVAKKNKIKVAHVEAGIRSYDITMPEEVNRLVTDSITDYFFTTTKSATNNLLNSGIRNDKIFFVGNTMVDTLLRHRVNFKKPFFFDEQKLKKKQYYVLTLHRPSNVDNPLELERLLKCILINSDLYPIIFPVHPRTLQVLKSIHLENDSLFCCSPLGYLEFNFLVENSRAVITDSGGITEEATILGVPCLTLRNTTERPETVNIGTNELVGTSDENISKYMSIVNNDNWKQGSIPEKWDGESGKRIVQILNSINN
jgi:UDP-N-acetylglucosamine 2-epimerase (non-hydrolysing)